ncbi:MAG: hypothetical protein PUA93_01875 [Eubacteriales bacterium]|nr:hypothetical protein [Eubacteriales bacterium]
MHGGKRAEDSSLEKYTPNPWSIYDRISSVKLHNVNGQKGKEEVFKGILIGQRQIMGIKDSYVVPILTGLAIIALGFAFISKFFVKDDNDKTTSLSPAFWILELFFFLAGLAIGGYLLYQGIKGRKYNREHGMSAIYLDPEKRVIAIRDIQGLDLVLPMSQIFSFFRLSAFELTISGIGLKIFPRLILHYVGKDGKKHWEIVHFLDKPEEVVHIFDAINNEYRGEEK